MNDLKEKKENFFRQVELETGKEPELNIRALKEGLSTLDKGDFASKNFRQGRSGWRLREDGTIEALNGYFAGTFNLGGTLITLDDIRLLQDVIDFLGISGGGTVSLVPNTYFATSSFTIPSNVIVQGNGSTIDFGGGAYQFLIQGSDAYSTGTLSATFGSPNIVGVGTVWTDAMVGQSILIGDYWYTIASRTDNTHIALTSNFIGVNLAGDTYVIATAITGASILNLTLTNSSTTLLRIRYCNYLPIDGVVCSVGSQGIDVDDSSGVNLLNSTVSSCTIGVTYDNVPFCTFDNSNIFSISGGTGLSLQRVSNTAISAISIQGITGVGMKFTNCNDIGLVNFAYQQCSSHGIEFVSGNNDIEVMDGYINTCSGDGVKLTVTSDRIIITDNSILNCAGFGVNIAAASCDNNIISAVAFSNNTSGNINDSGTNTTLIPGTDVLFNHSADAGNIGTGEDDLYSDVIPASTLSMDGDKIAAEYGGTFVSSGTASREIRIYFGGTLIFDTGALTLSLSSAWTAYVTIIRVSASVVRCMISFATEGAALAAYTSYTEVTGLTLTNTQILKITGEAAGVGAATNDIVAKMGYVEWKSKN